MNKILVFDEKITGHHLEYLNHIYLKALQNKETEFIFAVPEQFQIDKSKLLWPEAENIKFRFLTSDELVHDSGKGILYVAWHGSRLIRKILLEVKPDSLFLIFMIRYMPFLPFFVPHGISVSGIIYRIYLYTWPLSSIPRKFVDIVLNYLYSHASCFHKIFILNDKASSHYLNKLWRTTRYAYLVDPYSGNAESFCKPGIRHDKLTFLHFGVLLRRKGTIEILHALKKLSENEQKRLYIIFAGFVRDEIKSEFYRLTGELKEKIDMEIHDEFVPYEKLEEYCTISDYLLMPYSQTAQSSGVITFAAKYSIPIIGPGKGLLGKLIRKYGLGISLNDTGRESLCRTFQQCLKNKPFKIHTNYLSEITIERFQEQIFSAF